MQQVTIPIQATIVPPIMERNQHVLIVVQNSHEEYILGVKNVYPPNIYRFVGGGIEVGEDFQLAAQRELEEELGLKSELSDLKPLAIITAEITGREYSEDNPLLFTTHLYHTQLNNQKIQAASDLDGLITLTAQELHQLAERYLTLSTHLDQNLGFSWADYGKLYGPIHQLALQLTIPQKSTLPDQY